MVILIYIISYILDNILLRIHKNGYTMISEEVTFKSFNSDKSIEELQYYTLLWISGLNFLEIEITFLKKIILSFPFDLIAFAP